MKPSEALETLMIHGTTQEICDEIDDAFRMVNYQAGQIEVLRQEIATYRRMLQLDCAA